MVNDFFCPRCMGFLNVGENIIFAVRKKNGDRGILFLKASAGEYGVMHHENYAIAGDDLIEFACPICHGRLSSGKDRNRAVLLMRDQDGKEYEIFLSRVPDGEGAYKVEQEGEAVETFSRQGEDYTKVFPLKYKLDFF